MVMTKKQFNAQSIREQVETFNSLLSKGLNITDCCRSCGITYSTIRDRFKKHNYAYNRILNKYEKIDEMLPSEDRLVNRVIEEINRNNKIDRDLKVETTDRYKLVNRSFSIDKSVLYEFICFCDRSEYKQYDILTQFIREGLNKYSVQQNKF